jgi:hypothetical protein
MAVGTMIFLAAALEAGTEQLDHLLFLDPAPLSIRSLLTAYVV